MPPFGLTPHEIASAVLDKVLLGAVAIGFGALANWRMEVFRSRRSTEAEFLRERTKRLDELHDLMLEVRTVGDSYSISALMTRSGLMADGAGQAKATAADGRPPETLRA